MKCVFLPILAVVLFVTSAVGQILAINTPYVSPSHDQQMFISTAKFIATALYFASLSTSLGVEEPVSLLGRLL
jgi:hypothetical protein